MALTGQSVLFSKLKATCKQARVLTAPQPLIKAFGLHAGMMLSQMLYWVDKTESADGWFHKTRKQWQDELGMSEWHVREALAELSSARVIESRIVAWDHGRRTVFRVDAEVLMTELEVRGVMRIPHDGSGESLTTGHEDSSRPPTPTPYMGFKMTSKMTRGATSRAGDASSHQENPQERAMNQFGMKTRREKTITKNSAQVLDTMKKRQAAEPNLAAMKVRVESMEMLWKRYLPKYNPGLVKCVPALTREQQGKLKRLMIVSAAVGQNPLEVLKCIMRDWYGFSKDVQGLQALKSVPLIPTFEFIAKWANEAVNFYMKSGEKALATVVAMQEVEVADATKCKLGEIAAAAKMVKVNEEDQIATLEDILAIEKAWKEAEAKEAGK